MSELVAIVTGASQGIGRATAKRLAKDFSGVALAARDRDALKEVEAEVNSSAPALTVALDLRTRESAEILVKNTFERFGRIDALINIAGGGRYEHHAGFRCTWHPGRSYHLPYIYITKS